jgi:V-type H+-transporting ATPase subunit a
LNGALEYRYLMLLMGFMSVYCGFIYNEWFAIPTQIFNSCYMKDIDGTMQSTRFQWNSTHTEDDTNVGEYVFERNSHDCNYPMGIDPIWGITSNKLAFVNVIKMKVSVIMAIFHMSIGIVMKGTNSVYFGRWLDLITEVIFGLIILIGLFGWMDILIIAKWFKNIDIDDRSNAPDIPENRIYYETEDVDITDAGSNYVLAYNGDYINRHVPSIINIMITAVFNFGAYKGTP